VSGSAERVARAGLIQLAEPNDARLAQFVERVGAVEALSAIRSASAPLPGVEHYRSRLPGLAAEATLERAAGAGVRLLIPGDLEWPTQLSDLLLPGGGGDRAAAPPLGLWARGIGHLRLAAARSAAIVGARAATSYGTHVAAELAAGLCSGHGFSVFSGGAFGIDAAAHRGALAVGGMTVAVLACGVDVPYPRGNAALFDRIIGEGLLVSELPPGCPPSRSRFLDRNRLIAALTPATVVVEAAARSGALNTSNWADRLGRSVLATPGPVTSALSRGVHRQIQLGAAALVTCADDVAQAVTSLGEQFARVGDLLAADQADRLAVRRPGDQLDPIALRVFDALPGSGTCSLAELGVLAGLSVELVAQRMIQLEQLGYAEPDGDRFRLGRLVVEARSRERSRAPGGVREA